jgi:hypothetical protein
VTARVLFLGVMIFCAASGTATACQSTARPQLDETFANADPGWGQPDNIAAFTPQGLMLKPPPGGSAWRWNANYAVGHGDWCVTVVNPANLPQPANEDTAGAAGLWFWGTDLQNFYTATISPDGKATIDRLSGGAWHSVAAPRTAAAIKTAPGAANELEIVTNGNKATFFVNGTKIGDIVGHPPPNGGSPGVYGESGPESTTWLFTRAILF